MRKSAILIVILSNIGNITLGQDTIDVTVKILAVVVTNEYKTVVEKVPSYSNKIRPIHEE